MEEYLLRIENRETRQFLTIEAAETLCVVCLQPEEHVFRKKILR